MPFAAAVTGLFVSENKLVLQSPPCRKKIVAARNNGMSPLPTILQIYEVTRPMSNGFPNAGFRERRAAARRLSS